MNGITKTKQIITTILVLVCSIFIFSQSAQAQGKESENFKNYQQYAQNHNIATQLYHSPDEFFKAIIPENKNSENYEHYMLINYMGYSGAGYKADPIEGELLSSHEKFKQDFQASIEQHYNDSLNYNGEMGTKIIFMLGGTTDGFGEGYQWIQEFKDKKQQEGKDTSKIIVAGMVADQANLSDISPNQDYLLLVDSYKDSSGQSWELKKSKDDKTSILIELFNHSFITYVELFGGGAQAEKEILDWLENQSDTGTKKLTLYPGYQSAKQGQDYNAAKKLLVSDKINIESKKTQQPIIHIFVQIAGSESPLSFDQYLEQRSSQTVADVITAP